VGGSGGGGTYKMTAREVEKLQEQARERLQQEKLDSEINSLIQVELVDLNDRDHELIDRRLDEIEDALRENIEGLDRLLFGGSVAKHTYVNGLSDIDSLIVLEESIVEARNPEQMREEFRRILDGRLNMAEIASIDVGRIAVTVRYRDGTDIQLLPAVARGESHAISAANGAEWAQINPREFSRRLAQVNRDMGGVVVPAIKLAKAIVASQVPESFRPSGYHIESLAVAAFQDYSGPRTLKAMAQHLFSSSQENVLRPIPDVTGQSRHVDASLGPSDSTARRDLSRRFGQIFKRMRNATSASDWESLWTN
jgi:hypothetical protein